MYLNKKNSFSYLINTLRYSLVFATHIYIYIYIKYLFLILLIDICVDILNKYMIVVSYLSKKKNARISTRESCIIARIVSRIGVITMIINKSNLITQLSILRKKQSFDPVPSIVLSMCDCKLQNNS